jgi:UDP-glucose-4-epimerase GalE
MTRILVTGGAGYIGSHAARLLSRAGFEPVVLDNLSTGHRDNVRWGPFVAGDLADGDLVRRTLQEHDITAVIHFAASAYVGESMQQPRKYFRNNVVNSLNLLDAMLDTGVHTIVFSSSCATYGIPDSLPIREEQLQHPVNPYGESKLFVERAIHWYGERYGLQWTALRYFNVAGADPEGELGEEHSPETHLIPLVIEAALGRREHIEILGTDYPTPDGSAVRDYIHVADLATAHVAALQHLLEGGDSTALNLATGHGYSVREVVRAVEQVSGREVPVRCAQRREGDPPRLVADPHRAEQILGWCAEHSGLQEIVETAWRWYTREATSVEAHRDSNS